MKNKVSVCCQTHKVNSGVKKGIFYGLLPHSFCMAFIVFSVSGVVGVTSFFRRWLLTPYFFPLLVAVSVVFAFASMALYLRQKKSLSWSGVKDNKRYLFTLVFSVVGINLAFFLVVFPLITNFNSKNKTNTSYFAQSDLSRLSLKVAIPCSGHAPLVVEELKKNSGVVEVKFRLPNVFDVKYSKKTSAEEILGAGIFKNFKAVKI
jgi:hypothetical protein